MCLTAVAVLASGCSEDDPPEAVDVTTACDRLEDLAVAVKSAQSATTRNEVRMAVQGALEAFVDAAEESGDAALADSARTYEERFADYLDSDGNDAAEAGDDADAALDRGGARCTELGAPNEFPSES